MKKKKSTGTVGAPKKYTPKMLNELGAQLVQFVQRPDVYHMCEWTRSKGRSYGWWKSLKEGNKEILQTYHEQAKEILGHKILKNAFECNNSWAIQTFVPKYLTDIRKEQKDLEEEKLDRQIRFERAKHELGKQSDEEAKAKIDQFDMSINLMKVIKKYEEALIKHGISLDDL